MIRKLSFQMHAAVLVYKNVDKCKSDGATVQINKCQQTIITFPPELKMTSACMDSEAALAIVRMK